MPSHENAGSCFLNLLLALLEQCLETRALQGWKLRGPQRKLKMYSLNNFWRKHALFARCSKNNFMAFILHFPLTFSSWAAELFRNERWQNHSIPVLRFPRINANECQKTNSGWILPHVPCWRNSFHDLFTVNTCLYWWTRKGWSLPATTTTSQLAQTFHES